MENVSLFTTPTNMHEHKFGEKLNHYPLLGTEGSSLGIEQDKVLWRAMIVQQQDSSSGSNSRRRTSNLHIHNQNNYLWMYLPDIGKEPLVSSSVSMAVKNFQIVAEYEFYTNAQVNALSRVDLITEELVASFHLELPNFEVELDSTQFYIIVNVVKNLLLAPPPPIAKRMLEEQSKKVFIINFSVFIPY